MAFGEILLAGYSGQSRAGKMALSCPLGQPITAPDLVHLSRSRSQPHNREIREIKLDVTWSYVKRQTAKMTSEFLFFSSNPSLNHIKIEKCILLFATNTNIFTLLFKELKTDGKSFIFAVCRLTYDNVTSNLISLMLHFRIVQVIVKRFMQPFASRNILSLFKR